MEVFCLFLLYGATLNLQSTWGNNVGVKAPDTPYYINCFHAYIFVTLPVFR